MSASQRSVFDRFREKYEVRDCGHETPCWVWVAGRDRDGYGRFKPNSQVGTLPAHRVSYELFIGSIPEGLHIDHLCRNPGCVNPTHVEPVTCRENLMRGETYAASAAAQTHCIHGHEFTSENTYYKPPDGNRSCRECLRRRKREFRARLKVAA